MKLSFELWPGRYAVARLDPSAPPPPSSPAGFWSVTRTSDELSVVGLEDAVPQSKPTERGFRLLKVGGPLDFALTGVLAEIAGALAQADVSIFVLSTYDTDYVLVREDDLGVAVRALADRGHTVSQ